MTHLDTLELGLFNETARLNAAKTESEKQLRQVWVDQIKKEIAKELEFLGKKNREEINMTDDELLEALSI